MANRTSRITITAQDKASKAILGIHQNLKMLGGVAAAVGLVAIGRKLVSAVTSAVGVFSSFEQQLSGVAAVAGATGNQMGKLADQAKLLGRTTAFTAREAATAQETYAKAGFKVNEIMSALPGTLDLAAAGTIGLGEAADITAQIIRGFGLEAKDALDIANLLAKTANTANTTVSELGEGFRYVGPAAKALGVGVDETSAAMALLADRGLKGSIGGTALAKTMTTLLGNVNKLEGATGLGGLQEKLFDISTGEFVGMAEAFQILKKEGLTSADAFKIFGERAGKAASILLDSGDELEQRTIGLIERTGYAAQVAAKKLDNLAGDVTKMKSAFEGLQIATGETLGPALRVFTQQMTEVLGMFTASTEAAGDTTEAFTGIGSIIAHAGEKILTVVEWVKIGWLGLKLAFALVQEGIAVALLMMTQDFINFLETVNVKGVLDGVIAGVKDAQTEMLYFASGAHDVSEGIRADMAATTNAIGLLKEKFVEIRETVEQNEKDRKALAAAPETVEQELQGPPEPPKLGTGPLAMPGENSEEEIKAIKEFNKQVAETHESFLEEKLSAIQQQSMMEFRPCLRYSSIGQCDHLQ